MNHNCKLNLCIICPVVLTVLLGCVSNSFVVPIVDLSHDDSDPRFVHDHQDRYSGKYDFLGKPGETVTLCGVLFNGRRFEESEQDQSLLSSPSDYPFSPYRLQLTQSVLELPPCLLNYWDLPSKPLVGPYRITGKIVIVGAEDQNIYGISPSSIEPLTVEETTLKLCIKTYKRHWSSLRQNKVKGWEKRFGDFVLPLASPQLISVSSDGSQYLFLCAEGRDGGEMIEILARVYCLIHVQDNKVLKCFVESSVNNLD